ncbi:hypothetical protein BDV18DRAFT_142757 [Aspergillus unguis]
MPTDVRRPGMLDEQFEGKVDDLLSGMGGGKEEEVVIRQKEGSWTLTEPVQSVNGGIWTVSNITAPEAGPSAAEQMASIVQKIQTILKSPATDSEQRTTSDIVFTTILLRDMTDFLSMNGIYVSLFNKPNPPARATVACGDALPSDVNVMVSLVIDLGPRIQRDGLHVQSRSYWAPANIGPYSQAMSMPLRGSERVVYIAGQIPLEPASMELAEPETAQPSWAETFSLRAVLSLQHMWRIGVAMEVGWWLGTVAFFTGTEHVKSRARVAWNLWQDMHTQKALEDRKEEEESTLDVWDLKYGRRGHEQPQTVRRPQLPNFELVETDSETDNSKRQTPGFFAVQVHELPKNSDIEWQGLGYRCESVRLTRTETDIGRMVEATTHENLSYSCIEIDSGADLEEKIQRLLETSRSSGSSLRVIYTSQPLSQDCCQGQIVPCKSIWGAEGRELAAGVIIQSQT